MRNTFHSASDNSIRHVLTKCFILAPLSHCQDSHFMVMQFMMVEPIVLLQIKNHTVNLFGEKTDYHADNFWRTN